MAQIFLSYARTDKATASRVVEALQVRGWSVWWDPSINPGQDWLSEIQHQLKIASCVVVLWSHTSVISRPVQGEAGVGADRGILVPAKIDNVELPITFRALQTVDLTDWLKTGTETAIGRLLDGVGLKLQRAAEVQSASRQPMITPGPEGSLPAGRPIRRRTGSKARGTKGSELESDNRAPIHGKAVKAKSSEVRRTAMVTRKLLPGLRARASTYAVVNRGKRPGRRTSAGESNVDRVNVFVQLEGPPRRHLVEAHKPGMALYAGIRFRHLPRLTADASVRAVEPADPIVVGEIQTDARNAVAPPMSRANRDAIKGGVLIGIIDIGGFDFTHPDFLDQVGNTRFVKIWDQGGGLHRPPTGFRFGSEITQLQMNNAMRAGRRYGVPGYELEPQSTMAAGARATHLASLAGGNRGEYTQAHLAGVLLPPPAPVAGGAGFDSRLIALGVDYLFQLGESLRLPVSVVIGVGTNSAAHDASNGAARWLDASLDRAGRCISVGATGAHQSFPGLLPQWNERFGRVHTSGRIRDERLIERIDWIINGDGVSDFCETAIHIWYDRQDRFAVEVSGAAAGPIEVGESLESLVREDGTVISVYHDRLAFGGDSNHIACYFSPWPGHGGTVGVRAGTWTVRLHGREVRNGAYHGWIVRDERPVSNAPRATLNLPAYFSDRSSVPGYTLTGLACANRVLTVANLDDADEVIHRMSARGPTRDGRQKPEIAAPGTNMVAANGFDPSEQWTSMTGTAVAAAMAAGVSALMLAEEPRLTSRDVAEIVTRTAKPLPGTDFGWHDDAGFGCLDPAACLVESKRVHARGRK